MKELGRECDASFPAACLQLGIASDGPGSNALLRRGISLSIEGCRAGIRGECELALESGDPRAQLDTAQQLCDLDRSWCGALANTYTDRDDLEGARDSLELTCQYGRERWSECAKLGAGYIEHTYKEPVPGRGKALIDWACPRLKAKERSYFEKLSPECVRAWHPDSP